MIEPLGWIGRQHNRSAGFTANLADPSVSGTAIPWDGPHGGCSGDNPISAASTPCKSL
jgi:hypothetical protein